MNFTVYNKNKSVNFDIIKFNSELTYEVRHKNRFAYDILLDGKNYLFLCAKKCHDAIQSNQSSYNWEYFYGNG